MLLINCLLIIFSLSVQGSIAGGQHIFTFDGRHLTFPGSCKYVVSQDAVDGNFSIVITLENGNAKAINVVDKSGNDVEVNSKQVNKEFQIFFPIFPEKKPI